MRHGGGGIALVFAFVAMAMPHAARAADSTPPNLTALAVSPAGVDTTSASALVTFTAQITDDASGVASGCCVITLQSPSGKQTTAGTFFSDPGGKGLAAQVAIAAHAEPGLWTIKNVYLSDNAANWRYVYPSELALLGIDRTVAVSDDLPDTTPPSVSALGMAPTVLDAGATPAVATVTATLTDDLAGVSDTTDPCIVSCYGASLVYFSNPSHTHVYGFPFTHVGGDDYVAKVQLPAGADIGTWTLSQLDLVDLAGNERFLNSGEVPPTLRISFTVVAAGTAPTIQHVVTPSAPDGANGWYVTAPNVTFACADPTYGVASCLVDGGSSASTTLGESASSQVVAGTVIGNAGSIAHDSLTLRVDLSDPKISCRPAGFMLNQSGAEVTADVSDTTSGAAAPTVSAAASTGTAGAFTVAVTASDLAGRSTTVDCPYVVMATPTVATLTTFQKQTGIALSWSAPAGDSWVGSYDIRSQNAGPTGTFGPWATWLPATTATSAVFTGSPGATYCFSARARDAYGDLTPWSAYKCTAIPIDDTALTAAGNWTPITGTGYYLGTALTSSNAGDTLTLANVQAKRVGVLATKCPGCGTIQLYWNGALIAQASLNAATTSKGNLVAATAFDSLQTGTLTVKVASLGAPVEIDAVAVTQRFT